jgi:ATP-dependent exoDNAse (exonuclease V) alpha subunit
MSMASPEHLELLDAYLRAARGDTRAFGGCQFVAVGDPCQLPPVGERDARAPYVFEGPLWAACNFKYAVLNEVMRQKDETFLRILDAVREGQRRPFRDWEEGLRAALLARVGARAELPDCGGAGAVVLRIKNVDVDKANRERLQELPGEERAYAARAASAAGNGAAREVSGCALEALDTEREHGRARPCALKPGARVMLTYNLDAQRGLFNGSVGAVRALPDDDSALVSFAVGEARVPRVTCAQKLPDGGSLSLCFMPLRLAYAMTVHKSQGATLDAAEVLLDVNMSPGAALTALSRVRSLQSLRVLVPDGKDAAFVLERAFVTESAALEFMDMAASLNELQRS